MTNHSLDQPPTPAEQVQLLFVRHEGAIRAFVRALQPSLADADDVLQETFLTVSRKAASFELGTNFMAWACGIARLKVLESFRQQKRANVLSEAALNALADEAPAADSTSLREGRGTGILEAIHVSVVADALGLLAESKAWPKDEQKALKEWLRTYHDWLIKSEPGKDEHRAMNNHGTFFDVQAVRIALGRDDSAKRMLEEAKQRRIAVQIEPDGKQPLELDRTTSFSYSRFNLSALTELATLGEHVGVDLWNFTTEDGRSIRKAMDYMLPYADVPPKPWPLPQIKDKQESEFIPIFCLATLAYGTNAYEAVIAKFDDSPSKRFQLLFVK